ncbi:integrin alpha-X-like [Triplophysa rosa]|uniref:integrin alpha-X-like n=1 Tax=Triplophysa rosa TaxID=992332 RepID=UPI002545F67C|nr:integrin alpha-X-like [Triplophysa rosa]
MEQNICISLCIFCVFQSVMAFNIDPISWRYFSDPARSQNTAFGYKMIQEGTSLIVSDPLIQINQQRGQIYNCPVESTPCRRLVIKVPPEAVNMSLGLSMIQDPYSSKLAICGPTIPKKCESITTYNGMCFVYQNSMAIGSPEQSIPSSLRDCLGQIDIAFLLDGSGSVGAADFIKMKIFVASMIKRFTGRDARFAIAQYSNDCYIHYKFNQLNTQGIMWENEVSRIPYKIGGTYTAAAIKTVVDVIFGEARQSATKILLVITDGESNDRAELPNASKEASRKNIICMAIGVGSAFSQNSAKEELNTIATDPDSDHVFRVTDFNALNNILHKLEENIIAIEGTQTSGDSSRMEFAQDGFSTAFTSRGNVLVSVPGAFQWKGGYEEYSSSNVFKAGIEHDSYLGYSMAEANVLGIIYAILGAPRYQHKGQVVVDALTIQQTFSLDSPKPQIGSYFGAELCVVDLNADKNTDLLLVSAPTYTEGDREGKVFVYSSHWRGFTFSNTELVGMAGQRGRFGSSVSSPTDLNRDGFNDIVIGAPLEDDGQGSIYIFNGKVRGIVSKYSQRIGGSSVQSGLRLFGISLSQSSLDQSRDNLPDIAVGSMGAVLLLRSRPIMMLETKVNYNPSKISTSETDCTKPCINTLEVCFTMSGYKHNMPDLSANIIYTITLDSKRLKYRASFLNKKRILINEITLKLPAGGVGCSKHDFFIEGCPEDALNPLSNQLNFTFEGLPSNIMQGLKPILLPEIKNTTDHNLDFEINCGQDNICIDDLKMDFNFTGSTIIEVGIMQEINVTVFVGNRGENSYNTHFILEYPLGLSYRKITSKQGRVECTSHDGEQEGSMGQTTCYISKPILKANAEAVFEITYSISKEIKFGETVNFAAEVKSGNGNHSKNSILFQKKTIVVKYAIYIALIRHENSTIHINFTAGKKDLKKPIMQILKVYNDLRETNFTVFISVPMKLGDVAIWTNSDFQISGCKRNLSEQQPVMTKREIKEVIKKHRVVNCSVAVCAVFTCDVNLMRNERILYNISGNVSSGWIEQTDLKAAVFELVSTAFMDYDKSKYVFFSTDSRHSRPTVQIITQVEVYAEVDLTKEIIGGVIGGLLLMALITAALYKAGFFKSEYKQMLEEAQGAAGAETAE